MGWVVGGRAARHSAVGWQVSVRVQAWDAHVVVRATPSPDAPTLINPRVSTRLSTRLSAGVSLNCPHVPARPVLHPQDQVGEARFYSITYRWVVGACRHPRGPKPVWQSITRVHIVSLAVPTCFSTQERTCTVSALCFPCAL